MYTLKSFMNIVLEIDKCNNYIFKEIFVNVLY